MLKFLFFYIVFYAWHDCCSLYEQNQQIINFLFPDLIFVVRQCALEGLFCIGGGLIADFPAVAKGIFARVGNSDKISFHQLWKYENNIFLPKCLEQNIAFQNPRPFTPSDDHVSDEKPASKRFYGRKQDFQQH